MKKKIAILGWGSLLWDECPCFDNWHEAWTRGGPTLPIEFSRVSQSRNNALTLVIDPRNGAPIEVSYCLSERTDPQDAVCDLRCREGTTLAKIGCLSPTESPPDTEPRKAIFQWAKKMAMDSVVWTDLGSNFEKPNKKPFSVEAALSYLKDLSPAGKAAAFEYIVRAPGFVQTPLRTALQTEPWFRTEGTGNEEQGTEEPT